MAFESNPVKTCTIINVKPEKTIASLATKVKTPINVASRLLPVFSSSESIAALIAGSVINIPPAPNPGIIVRITRRGKLSTRNKGHIPIVKIPIESNNPYFGPFLA